MNFISVLLVLLCFVACALSVPKISSDFSAKVTITETGPQNRTQTGSIYEDFKNQKQRLDVKFNHGALSLIGFYMTGNRTEYVVTHGSSCHDRRLQHALPNRWDWLKNAKQSGSCTVLTTTGTLWKYSPNQHVTVSLCVDSDGATPLQVAEVGRERSETITFATWTAGTPDPSSFQCPSSCFDNNGKPTPASARSVKLNV